METAQKIDFIGVAHTLKVYFQRMPDPLLSEAFKLEMKPKDLEPDDRRAALNCVLQSADSLEDKLTAIRDILQRVDQSLIKVMRYFFKFLHQVSLHAEKNKTTSANLAIVFEGKFGSSFTFDQSVIQLFIDHHEVIFGDEQVEHDSLAPLQSPLRLPAATSNIQVSVVDFLCYLTLSMLLLDG